MKNDVRRRKNDVRRRKNNVETATPLSSNISNSPIDTSSSISLFSVISRSLLQEVSPIRVESCLPRISACGRISTRSKAESLIVSFLLTLQKPVRGFSTARLVSRSGER